MGAKKRNNPTNETSPKTSNKSQAPSASRNILAYSPHYQYQVSLLSTESKRLNSRGLLNLAGLIIFMTNFRLMIENLNKYGFMISNPGMVIWSFNFVHCAWIFAVECGFVLASWFFEAFVAHKLTPFVSQVYQFLIVIIILVWPVWTTAVLSIDPIYSLCLLLLTTIMCLKTISFAHITHNARMAIKNGTVENLPKQIADEVSKYPNCLTLYRFIYFLMTPTLCFQFTYPQTTNIRKRFVAKRAFEGIICLILMLFIGEQYVVPTVRNALPLITAETTDYGALLERLLKLALPSTYMWLLMFYAIFHCWVNVLGELLYFADRNFYDEWWNATTMGEYWRLWNKPVHQFLKRHVYMPLRGRKLNPYSSMAAVFFISAVFHEYLFSGAVHILSVVSFMGMMVQVPFIFVQELLKPYVAKSQIGNLFFWISFCIVGQPLAILIYTWLVVSSN